MKKLIVSFVLATLFLSVASLGIAAGNKPNNIPPDTQKITFVHYAKSSDHSKPSWDDTEDNFKLIAGGVKWTSTVNYEVNPSSSGLDSGVVTNTLDASLETWDSNTAFELFASPTVTTETSVGLDGKNRIVWGALSPGVIAVNYLWYSPATKQIVESDVVFNTYYTWSTTGASSAMDLQNIATHEFGHNGLNDLKAPRDWALTMYAYSGLGETDKQTLGTGDILGIQKLYGS
jgi:hypothetical protein